MGANETQYHVSVNADGVESGLSRAQKSWDAYQAAVSAAADKQVQKQKAIDEAVANGADTSSRAQRSIKSFMDSLAKEADQAGLTRAQLLELRAAQLGVSDSAQQYIAAIQKAGDASHGSAGSARELMVMLHEISQGNFTRLSGSLMVFANQMQLAKYLFNPVVLGIGSVAAAGYVVYEAMHKAAQGQQEIANAMAITGNYAGLTTGVMLTYADAISRKVGVSSSDAAAAIEGLAKSGLVSASQLEAVSLAVVAYSKASGESAEDVSKQFQASYGDAAEAAKKWQQTHHDLTDEQIKNIQIIEQSGDKAKAWSTFVIEASAAAEKQVVSDNANMGISYETLSEKWGRFWRGLTGGGDQLSKLQDNLKALEAMKLSPESNGDVTGIDKQIADTKAQIAAILNQKSATDANAAAIAQANAAKSQAALLDEQAFTRQQKLTKAIQDATKARDAAIASLDKSLSPETRQKAIDAQNALYGSQVSAAHRDYDPRKTTTAGYKTPKGESMLDQATAAGAALQAQLDTVEKLNTWEQKRVELQATIDGWAGKTLSKQQQSVLANQQALLSQYTTNAQLEAEVKNREEVEKLRQDAVATLAKIDDQAKAQADQQQLDLATATMSTQEKQKYLALLQIQTNMEKELTAWRKKAADLHQTGSKTDIDTQAGIVAKYGGESANVKASYAAKDAANSDWVDGAKKALTQYQADAQNVAAQVQTAFQGAFTGMEDAFVKFCQTGKFDFGDLAKSVVADLEKMAAKSAISGLFSWGKDAFNSAGGFAGIATSLGFADGGHVQGAGSGTSDSIAAWLSNGEYVLTADTVQRVGVGNLDALNNGAHIGSAARFASGGLVSSQVSSVSGASAGSGSNVAVTVNSGGGLDQSDGPILEKAIKAIVDSRIAQKMKGQGGYAWQLKNGSV